VLPCQGGSQTRGAAGRSGSPSVRLHTEVQRPSFPWCWPTWISRPHHLQLNWTFGALEIKLVFFSKSIIKFISIQHKSIIVHVWFFLFIICLYICVCECLLQSNNHKTKHKNNTTSKQHSYVWGPLRECGSFQSGASGLPYYCTLLVCCNWFADCVAA